MPEYQYKSDGQILISFSDRNKYRLPSYNRLDLSFSVDESLKKKKIWKGSWTFSVLNVYAYTVFYRKEKPSVLNNYKLFNLYKMYIIGIPLPTITYNFIF